MQAAKSTLLAATALAGRELKRFVRQRSRLFGALAQPVMFWGLFGAGLSPSFAPAGMGDVSYIEYFFPGTVALILLFTAIFATISIIDDRNEGFLQSVLVAPIPRPGIALGKLVGTTVLAVGQGLIVWLMAPMAGIDISIESTLMATGLMTLIAFSLAGLGFTIAWNLDSTQGFHAIMTAFLMPMWFLSGAFFPADGLPAWLAWIVTLNPLTYGVAALRHALYLDTSALTAELASLPFCITVVASFALVMLLVAIRTSNVRRDS